MSWADQWIESTIIGSTAAAVDRPMRGPRFERPKARKAPDAVEREAGRATLPPQEMENWAEVALRTPSRVTLQAVTLSGATHPLWTGTPQEVANRLSALRDYQRRAQLGYPVPVGYQPMLFIIALLGEDVELSTSRA